MFLLFGANAGAFAQNETDSVNGGIVEKLFDTADKVVASMGRGSWTFIPALTYAPETSFGIGARAIKVFKPSNVSDSVTRPSSLPITFLYTLNRQAIFTGEIDLWTDHNRSYLNGRIELTDYPFWFYGIGQETGRDAEEYYATRYFYFHLDYERKIARGIYLGPRYEFRADDIYQKLPGGALDSGRIPGSSGQRLSGFGMVLNYDTRDHIFQPSEGVFHRLSYMGFHSLFGSNFNFGQYVLDARKYLGLNNGQVLVGQAWLSFTSGNAPFQHVSLIGGSDLMRGYFEGRFRDRHAMVYQTEYRIPVYRHLGIVIFGSAGQVAGGLPAFGWDRFKWGGGLGFRYQISEDGLTLRLDIAFGDQRAFYFGLNEVI
ncbi:MAG: BamA/TamA family outer membrane protein [Cyclobacteriaceae bacterium]